MNTASVAPTEWNSTPILWSTQGPGIARLGFTVGQAALANLADGTGPRITLQEPCYLADITLYKLLISLDSSPLFRHDQTDSDFGFSFTCIASPVHVSLHPSPSQTWLLRSGLSVVSPIVRRPPTATFSTDTVQGLLWSDDISLPPLGVRFFALSTTLLALIGNALASVTLARASDFGAWPGLCFLVDRSKSTLLRSCINQSCAGQSAAKINLIFRLFAYG